MREQPGLSYADVSRHARLYGHVWRATRTLFVIALSVFIPLYYLSVATSDFYATSAALVAQPILLAAVVFAWRATGSVRRGVSIGVCLFLVVFAGIGVEVVARIAIDPDGIKAWHESMRRNDPNLAPALEVLGPNGAVALFIVLYGALAALLMAGAVASVLLLLSRVPGTGRRLRTILAESRRQVAVAGDAPDMLRQLSGGRRVGLVIALAAAAVLLLPLLLPGREAGIPLPQWSIDTLLPTLVAFIVVALSDRAYAWPVALVAALALWRCARRFLSPDARFMLALDRRPPLLLLRSFADDRSAVRPSSLWSRLGLRRKRLEEVAAVAVADIGPFIAVGDPAVRLPELGAFRAKLPDHGWQEAVKTWIGEARAILLVAGTSTWVTWELEQIVAANALDRTLLLVPPGLPAEVEARWSHVAARLSPAVARSAIEAVVPTAALAVRFTREGGIVIVTAAERRERDYDLAVRVGLHGILAQHGSAGDR